MSLQRLSVKYFIRQPAAVRPSEFVAIFQKWIQEHTVEGLLIDVVDYKHVYQGPGVILIGHEADYALDFGEGRPGLLYTRKRALQPDLHDTLRDAFRLALTAAEKIETDKSLDGVVFDPSEMLVSFHDRLRMPNTAETLTRVQDDLRSVLQAVYGDADFELELANADPRQLFGIRAALSEAVELSTLLHRLEAGVLVSN